MFVLEDYIKYLETNMKLSYFSNPNSKYSKQDFLDSLLDFDSGKHGSALGARPGDQIKRLLPILAVGKPRSVSYTVWFLYLYGYKYCSSCKNILTKQAFSSNRSTWNQLSAICKKCDNSRCTEYKSENKEKAKITYELWYKNNQYIRAAASAKRRASKLQATPKWLSKEQLLAITNMYAIAYKESKHVDHIVPLQGKYVCGLHVPWNLQIISKSDNLSKSNYHESEQYWDIL